MIFLKRKRLIIWLLRAYFKKWGKVIFLSFFIGVIAILFLYLNRNFLVSKIPSPQSTHKVGIAGIYSETDFPNNMPNAILDKLSRGLTKVSTTGVVLPDASEKWEIKDDGKTYVFYLKRDLYFSDGDLVISSNIRYNFEDVNVERPTDSVIVFRLKDRYSPFLVTLANNRIFKEDLNGVSEYKINKIKKNSGFLDYIEIYSKSDRKKIKYDFYDTQAALKSAFVLGEVDEILDVNDLKYSGGADFGNFKNTLAKKEINDKKIVTVFVNNKDAILSDKKIRKSLAYVMPDKFSQGERAQAPYKKHFWASTSLSVQKNDLEYAKTLLNDSSATQSGKLEIELKTLPQYEDLAKDISRYWSKLGIKTKIEVVYGIPSFYQAFLGEFPILDDPDQYTLWHSHQPTNITNYVNLRIDKLLEDGRTTIDLEDRKNIYGDFQKYLIDDMPAIFLYFPYTYTITRK